MSIYTKYHCILAKNDYVSDPHFSPFFKIEEKETILPYFKYLFMKVGTRWKWTLRPKYLVKVKSLSQRLESNESKLFIFKKGEQLIGYAFVVESEEPIANKYENLIEIENFGFFPEYTNKAYGSYFLNKLFASLFEKYDYVYLTSRSTNHSKVIPFYKRNGMTVIYKETLPDDLVYLDDQYNNDKAA
jgi:ribosomal protein S18 acetylase RimI-like enzyme